MTGTNIHDGGSGRYVGGETPTRDDHLATKKYVDDHSGGSIDVTDGDTTVSAVTELDFTSGATVTDAGGGVAQVAVSGGGSVPFVGVDPPDDPSDGELWWDPDDDTPADGGSQPVSTFLALDAESIDLTDANPAYIVWDTIYDNCADRNSQEALPDGLGLTGFGTDTLTTTEAGVWAFSWGDFAVSPDATWTGDVNFGNLGGGGGPSFQSFGVSLVAREASLSQVLGLPAGAGFSIGISTVDVQTADPYLFKVGTLAIVRLG